MKKNSILKTLHVISPFKGESTKLLENTIESLMRNRTQTLFKHKIIYDKSSKDIILRLKNKIKYEKDNKFYRVSFHEVQKEGIYSAINLGLENIPLQSHYIVIGAGDLFKEIKGSLNVPRDNIILLPYKLSSSIKNEYLRNLRSFYSGMPYCHNAIIYINDGSMYSNKYKISSDYEHFLKYVKKYKLTRKTILKNFQEEIFVVFESSIGISSKSKFLKYFENILIIYRDSGYLKLILYFWHNFRKVFILFWNQN